MNNEMNKYIYQYSFEIELSLLLYSSLLYYVF